MDNFYANQDIANCPYPLYKTKEDIINQIKKNKMNIDDLTIKVIKVTL